MIKILNEDQLSYDWMRRNLEDQRQKFKARLQLPLAEIPMKKTVQ